MTFNAQPVISTYVCVCVVSRQWRSQGHCFGGGSSERRRHSRGSAPNFYTDLDFWNGLEHNWGGGRSPLNYATVSRYVCDINDMRA